VVSNRVESMDVTNGLAMNGSYTDTKIQPMDKKLLLMKATRDVPEVQYPIKCVMFRLSPFATRQADRAEFSPMLV